MLLSEQLAWTFQLETSGFSPRSGQGFPAAIDAIG
jgi:hypothetical protein